MTIKFSCPECGKSFSVNDESSGKKAKCPCGARIVVPDATSQLRVSDPGGNAREIMPGQSSHELQFSDSSGHESSLRPAPPQALQDVVYCRKCGTRNDGNAFKCVECGEVVQDVQQARIPYDFCFAFTTAVRFVPVLADEAQNIMDAQRSRGLELDKGSFLSRVRKYIPILIPLIVGAIRRSLEMAEAMESRAFGAKDKRTNLYQLEMRSRDWIILMISLFALIFSVYVRYYIPIPSI